MAVETKKKTLRKTGVAIVILLSLTILTAGALAARLIYLNFFTDRTVTTVVPDNLIGEETEPLLLEDGESSATDKTETQGDTTRTENTPVAVSQGANQHSAQSQTMTTISLHKANTNYNERFEVYNMLPGDYEVKYFAVKLNHHKNVTLTFDVDVTGQTKNLGNVLYLQVTNLENNRAIYYGKFTDIDKDGYKMILTANESTETIVYYKVEVFMLTSAGNEYQAGSLVADFDWFVEDIAALDSPQTGDTGSIVLWYALCASSLAMIFMLLFARRRRQEEHHAD